MKKEINETSINSLLERNEKFDCFFITAFRLTDKCDIGRVYTKRENMARNYSLELKLARSWYSATRVVGTYNDNEGKKKKEISFFVVNNKVEDDESLEKRQKHTREFLDDMIYLGELFEQDSILFLPKGSFLGKAKPILYGTNNCPEAIGKGNKEDFNGGAKISKTSKLYTTIVNGKPMYFESAVNEIYGPQTGFGNLGLALLANTPWKDLLEYIDEKYQKNYFKNPYEECCKNKRYKR